MTLHHLTRPLVSRGAAIVVGAMSVLSGCASAPSRPPGTFDAQAHAEALRVSASADLESDPLRAAATLREAQRLDPYSGAIANNLGVALLLTGDLPEAARQCTLARKLLHASASPRINLGLVYERAGRIDHALAELAAALALEPDSIAVQQELARLQVSSMRTDARTPALLQSIAVFGTTQSWRAWATQHRGSLSHNKAMPFPDEPHEISTLPKDHPPSPR